MPGLRPPGGVPRRDIRNRMSILRLGIFPMRWTLLLLAALVGCELPTANPEQGSPEQAPVFEVRGICVQYFVPPRYYDRVPDSASRCAAGDRPEVIGIAYAPARKRSCAETYLIPHDAKQVYGCVKRPPITETPL